MTTTAIKFNKTALRTAIAEGTSLTLKDTEVAGLKFKVGKRRSTFQFEKRISGKKGAPITITIGAFPAISIDDARQQAREYATFCEKGIDPRRARNQEESENAKILLRNALEKFFELKTELAPRTVQTYRDIVKYQFPHAWMDSNILEITPDMIVSHFHVVRTTARDRCWKFLKLWSNMWNTCMPFFRNANGERLLTQNPIPEVRTMLKHIKPDKPKRSVVPVHLLGKCVVTLERLRSGELQFAREVNTGCTALMARTCDMMLLSLFTGLRWTEVQNLKWEYIDLEEGFIQFEGESRKDDDFETKNHEDHYVPLSSYVRDLIASIHSERVNMSPYVFPSVNDPNKTLTRAQQVFERLAELIGCHYTPHTNRRTFASVADEAGIGFLTVKRMLNHFYEGGVTGGHIVSGFNPNRE